MKKTQQGQVYFVHVPTGVRTWHDPRIPKDVLQFISASKANNTDIEELLGQMPSGKLNY